MAQFTPDDLQAAVRAPMMMGLAIAMVDVGLVSTALEAAALSKQVSQAASRYPHNTIIQAAFAADAPIKLDTSNRVGDNEGTLFDKALIAVRQAIHRLAPKATAAEIREYKQFIYDCAVAVAEAAGQGLLGRGTKVSPGESAALARLKTALSLDEDN